MTWVRRIIPINTKLLFEIELHIAFITSLTTFTLNTKVSKEKRCHLEIRCFKGVFINCLSSTQKRGFSSYQLFTVRIVVISDRFIDVLKIITLRLIDNEYRGILYDFFPCLCHVCILLVYIYVYPLHRGTYSTYSHS